ncbi:MAG: site-specific DNA-methyltransferase [Labilibaculum antarcticum]
MDKEQKTTNNIKVPNKNMEVLQKHFSHCFDKSGNFDIEKFKQELTENEIDFYKESYGLDWLGKSYSRILASDEASTLLKEDEEFNQREENKNSKNLLIKGDNLQVLKHLSNAYYEKIKMIYIDPPYNTGSDGFVYQDDRKFTISELRELAGVDEEKAKRILDFTQSKSNSHSAWLTFMYPRLYIAKQLLKNDGVIFISIDDNEVAQLKILMDEVFGEENFVANLIWKRRVSSGMADKNVSDDHDFVMCYQKGEMNGFNGIKKDFKKYSNPDNDPRGPWISDNLTVGMNSSMRPNQAYDLVDPATGLVFPYNPNRVWAFIPKSMEKMISEGRILFPNDVTKRPMQKRFKNELKSQTNPFSSLMLDMVGLNTEATRQIQDLMGTNLFEYSKPVSLITVLVSQVCNNDEIILDFFAGSGTTGDAVMQINVEDGSNRKYILVQLPEAIDPKKSKTAFDFVKNDLGIDEPSIFEITKERLIRASKKIKEETIVNKITKQKAIAKLNDKLDLNSREEKNKQIETEIENLKNQDLGFKIFETMPIWEDYNYEAEELDLQTKLFDESKLTEEDVKALLITWKTYDGLLLTEDLNKTDLGGYTGYYSNEKLYLMDKGFTTDNLKALLEKVDTDKKFNPTSIIAFGYHFDSKNLREISENIKSYSNKKNIDIDFITRY